MRAQFRTRSLHWASGALLAMFGMLVLVAPHQFSGPAYTTLQPQLLLWGLAFLTVGVGLILTVTVVAQRRWVVATLLGAGGLLLLLSYGFWVARGINGMVSYFVLGVGCLIAAALPLDPPHRPHRDLFALLIAISNLLSGLLFIVIPGQFTAVFYDPIRAFLPWNAAAFLVGGLALLVVCLLARPPRWAVWLSHLLAALALWAWMVSTITSWILTGMVYSSTMGLLIALLPWLGPHLDAFDPQRLRVRLGLALSASAALPLILALAVITQQQQRLGVERALATQRDTASVIAQDVTSYLLLHRGVVITQAQRPRMLMLPPEEQRDRLVAVHAEFPDFAVLQTFDAAGQPLARSDDAPLGPPISTLPLFTEAQRTGQPVITLGFGLVRRQPRVEISAPVLDPSGTFLGIVVGVIETEDLGARLALVAQGTGNTVALLGGDGRLIAQAGVPPALIFLDRSALPPVAALKEGASAIGALRYRAGADDLLAGYARLPAFGWGVVVEQPTQPTLASVYAGRNLAFGVLLVMLAAALLIGVALTRQLSHPLQALSVAAQQVADEIAYTPLPPSPVREVADLTAIFGTMRDRLAARTAERDALYASERVAREQAEHAVKMHDVFLSVASHELRNLLAALLGRAQLLQRRLDLGSTVNERDIHSINVLVAQAQRMTRLVSGLLDFSQLEQGQLRLQRTPIELGSLAERVVAEIMPTLSAHTLTYASSDEPLIVVGDAIRLEQVLLNLLQNAVRYSPEGGPVTVQLRAASGSAELSVADRGIGIPAADLPRLFQRFARAGNVEAHRIAGTGLGLYVVAEIVRLHGGEVRIESAEGQGSTFTIVLPLAPAEG